MDIKYNDDVYRPAEDTYLMMDNIKCGKKVLEIGAGTGIISVNLALNNHDVTATDIDDKAIDLIKENARINHVNIKIIKSDLFDNIYDKYDTIIFNPPYLPVENEDIKWSGGSDGFNVTSRFLKDAYMHLNDNGSIYIILSDLTDINKLKNDFKNYEFIEIKRCTFDFESIILYMLRVRTCPQ
ncbi:HemK2/MTQ2 family protein methyltransferase [Picrophilus oshimae]|uniref:Methyltransferase n=1 Tax=Picrophilus torridus (strain ATCC 700027 / DSM 9790 / JCM 10055 / NBRC 100828 / KAW 2/3) TaxID=1122961 RepID=Q6L2I2_PICTO|nr:HemK2/MTQ2 family protein methyltransferase [Picrophilus oshimae]AAT42820.1 methyltransferase [Picrophilus oshimae DSM 9789]SMD31580.1 release factor glutamine methyltransferase [Picrophilus oshimae DSM 9789]